MFSLNRYAPQFHPDHEPSTSIQVQGQLPNPLSITEAQRLALELKRVLGQDWPFAAPVPAAPSADPAKDAAEATAEQALGLTAVSSDAVTAEVPAISSEAVGVAGAAVIPAATEQTIA